MEILKYCAWPAALIIVVIFLAFLFRKPILDLIKGINAIKYGNFGADISQSTNKPELQENLTPEQAKQIVKNELLERSLGIISDATKKIFEDGIESETNLSSIPENDKFNHIYQYSIALFAVISFERIYTSIFGSQLAILTIVNSNSSQTIDSLKSQYDIAKSVYPALYDTYPYEDYFNFLKVFGLLLVHENGICQITWFGRDFLKYIMEAGKPMNKAY